MPFQDGIFTSAITSTLGEPAVMMVNFRARGRVVGTMHLGMISQMITNGQIRCRIDPSKVPTGAVAAYSHEDKTIYGTKAEGFYAEDKAMFVHECTHAMFHVLGFARAVTMKVLDDEIAAYLAGAIYVVASGVTPFYRDKNAPDATAFTISSGHITVGPTNTTQTNAGSPINFSDTELRPLIAAIQASRFYRNWNNTEVYRWP